MGDPPHNNNKVFLSLKCKLVIAGAQRGSSLKGCGSRICMHLRTLLFLEHRNVTITNLQVATHFPFLTNFCSVVVITPFGTNFHYKHMSPGQLSCANGDLANLTLW